MSASFQMLQRADEEQPKAAPQLSADAGSQNDKR